MRAKKNDWGEADDLFRYQVGMLRGCYGLTLEYIATRMHMAEQTLRRKLRDPSMVTKGEERRLAEVAKECGMQYRNEFSSEPEQREQRRTARCSGYDMQQPRMYQ